MRSGYENVAVASAQATTRVRTIAAPQAFLLWIFPALYPLSLSARFRSAALTRVNVALGSGFLTLAIAWLVAGPIAGWLALNYRIATSSTAVETGWWYMAHCSPLLRRRFSRRCGGSPSG
jgi:hypothetical protein